MKILYIITSLGYGGAERVVTDLAKTLHARGHQVQVISISSDVPLGAELKQCGIAFRSLEFAGTIYSLAQIVKLLPKLRAIICEFAPAVIHSHLYAADCFVRLAAPAHIPIVSTLHNTDKWWREDGRIRSKVKTWLDASLVRKRDVGLVAVSHAVKAAAERVFTNGGRRGEIKMIWNGIDLSRFQLSVRSSSPSLRIVQVGRFYEQKGHETSLRALSLLVNLGIPATLSFVGDGPLRNSLVEKVSELNLADHVTFHGQTSNVGRYLVDCDLYWMPSIWEGLPIACIEAMASGLPVIASSVGGLSELVTEDCGILIEPCNYAALAQHSAQLYSDSPQRQRLGENGKSRAMKYFSMDAMCGEYERTYCDLVRDSW